MSEKTEGPPALPGEEYEALMREALPAAREASDPGEWGIRGAKGGTRAMLGRALLATVSRAERAEADRIHAEKTRDEARRDRDALWSQLGSARSELIAAWEQVKTLAVIAGMGKSESAALERLRALGVAP